MTYQERVRAWTHECFGDEVDLHHETRQAQLLEEALECVQAAGMPKSVALGLVDLVYGRPAGRPGPEAGDVMVAFAAFCTAHGLNMIYEGELALAKCHMNTEKIREKQKTKPFHRQMA